MLSAGISCRPCFSSGHPFRARFRDGRPRRRWGRQVGPLRRDTAGALAGVIRAGLLLALWACHAALKTAIVATLLLAAALLAASGRRQPRRLAPAAASVVAAAAVALAPAWDSRVMSSAPAVYAKSYIGAGEGRRLSELVADETVLFYRDGRSGTVAVTRVGPQTLLRINGKMDAGTVGNADAAMGAPAAHSATPRPAVFSWSVSG